MAELFNLSYCIRRLKAAQKSEDIELAHRDADKALCNFLEFLGYADVVQEYDKVPKWYA